MEYVHKLKFILFVLLGASTPLLADLDINTLWSAYVKGDANKVISVRSEILAERSSDMRLAFFKTLFEPNAEVAFSAYQKIISSTSDGELRFQAAKKIYEYYYARGFYITADEIESRFGLDKEVVYHAKDNNALELPPLQFVIQLGAFSDRLNADKMIKRISRLDKTILIKTKVVAGQKLHLVWVGPFNDRSSAEEWAELIEDKYKIHSRIKPMD